MCYKMFTPLILLSLIGYVFGGSCPTRCTWLPWEAWSTCSRSCGGGSQTRSGNFCGRPDLTYSEALAACGMQSDPYEHRDCNEHCYNGGVYVGDYCDCPKAYYDSCCNSIRPQPPVISNRQPDGSMTGTEGQYLTLTCTSRGGNPSPTVTWYRGSTHNTAMASSNSGPLEGDGYTVTATHTFSTTSADDGSIYICQTSYRSTTLEVLDSSSATLRLNFRPQPPVISNRQPDGSMTGTEGQYLTLTCTSRGGNPSPTVTWYRGSTHNTAMASSNSGPLEGDGYTVTATHTFSTTSADDGSIYICQTSYRSTTLEVLDSSSATLRLNLKPSQPTVEQVGDVVAGSTVTVRCTTAGFRPADSIAISWTYKGGDYYQHATTTNTSGTDTNTATSTLQFTVQKGDNGGRAECIVAHSTLGTPLTGTTTIDVHYPPDVTAAAQLNNGQLVVTCSPSGIPNSYYYSNWVHLWSDGTPIFQSPPLAATQTLTLTRLTYQDSGIYKCGAGNGVGLNGVMSAGYTREGSTSVITIESLPIVIGPVEQKVPIQLHEPSTVSATYYSNVGGSTVSCHRVVDNITKTQSVGEVTTEPSPIQLYVHGSVVSEQGTSYTITLTFDDKAELGAYVVKITNTVGTAVVHLLAVPEDADRRTSSSAVGPAVGGSAAALVVIALVVALVVLHKKGYYIMRPCKKKSTTYRDHTYENEVETNETRHEMSQARADSTTQDEGQSAALPYDSLTTTRVTTSTMYDELNITGAGLVGDTTRDGSVAGPYETLEPRQGENASFYEELRPRDLPEIPTGQEVKNERESSVDEELERLKREVVQGNERRLKLEQESERLHVRAELGKTNKEVAQRMNTDDRVIEYENLKIK